MNIIEQSATVSLSAYFPPPKCDLGQFSDDTIGDYYKAINLEWPALMNGQIPATRTRNNTRYDNGLQIIPDCVHQLGPAELLLNEIQPNSGHQLALGLVFISFLSRDCPASAKTRQTAWTIVSHLLVYVLSPLYICHEHPTQGDKGAQGGDGRITLEF